MKNYYSYIISVIDIIRVTLYKSITDTRPYITLFLRCVDVKPLSLTHSITNMIYIYIFNHV